MTHSRGGMPGWETARYTDHITAWPVDAFVKANDFTGKTVIPLRSFLPERCFSVTRSTEELMIIEKGG